MRTSFGIIMIFSMTFFFIAGCKKDSSTSGSSSSHGSTSSGSMSGNCQQCHVSGGSGSGVFTLAGTVWTQNLSAKSPNGTIYLWSGPNGTGTKIATLEVDANGNFYTTSSILPAAGAYPQIVGTSGDIRNMPQLCTSGSCNGCHSATISKIWVN